VIFVIVFSLGTLASPAAKPQGEVTTSDVVKRGGTRWTWYNVQTGNQVSCGGYRSNSEAIVALSGANMNPGLCGKRIQMTYRGVTQYATIVDTCPSCPQWALDLSQGLFPKFAPLDEGVIYGDWSFA